MVCKTFIVDIDGTICTPAEKTFHSASMSYYSDYTTSKPLFHRIAKINELYDLGHKIIYWTSRGMTSNIDWEQFTKDQLALWLCKYDELRMNKPMYDYWIDDKAKNADILGDW